MILSKLEDINKIKFNNKFKVEDALHRSIVILLGHPFTYSRTLMQIGYEPFRPILVDTLFGGSRYAYPNVFKYINYIQTEDGFLGLFRGVGFRMCSELLRDFCYYNTLDICKQIDKLVDDDNEIQKEKKKKTDDEDDDEEKKNESDDKIQAKFDKESIFKLLRKLICESISKTASLTITYPLQVCFIRGCSQFIGREKIYVFNPVYFSDIIKQGNFYDGFMPKLIAELVVLWLSSSLIFSLDATIEPDKLILTYLSAFINFFVSSTMYPLQLTSTVMAVNHSNLLASKIEPPFYSWRTCYDSLEKRNQLKRGSSLIWRYVANAYKPQAYVRPYFADDDD